MFVIKINYIVIKLYIKHTFSFVLTNGTTDTFFSGTHLLVR